MHTPQHSTRATAFATLHGWAQKFTSSLMDLRPAAQAERKSAPAGLTYLLRQWPSLPQSSKTADILRTLSVMSHRRVSRNWILRTSRLTPREVDGLLARLVEQDAVEVIDIAVFAREVALAK
ncbi:MAG: hypothetical protein EON92_05805 [Burkholderiales bacterium]|nr:MAG: hypothetical protein EON92_05805 [Burkholderiales bacterium]